ncbi:sensor histidine kinase [Paenibacillus sp. GCM10027626]|uniref:cache domain-containing sensor histidine kinase n=1 Tax=Paenibacillus sp. GCM10027626 TaxID=3273411 RepID=UPI00363E3477
MVLFNVLISVVPLVLVGVIAYSINYHNTKQSMSNSVDILFTQVNSRIEEYFDEINAISKSVFLSKSLQSIHQADEANWVKFTRIQNHLNAYLETNQSIQGIYWVDQNGSVYNTSSFSLRKEIDPIIKQFVQNKSMRIGELHLFGPIIRSDGKDDVYLAMRRVKTVIESNYLQQMGVGVLLLDSSRLSSIIGDSQLQDAEIYIVDGENRVIVSTNEQMNRKFLQADYFRGGAADSQEREPLVMIDGVSHLIKVSSVNKAGWKLVADIQADRLFAQSDVFKSYMTVIVAIVFIAVVFITLFFNIVITRPINKLIDAFAQAASGDLNSKVRFSEKNEITRMAVHFNKMMKELGELTSRQAAMQQALFETELEKKQFELNNLQSQINAHFLYNTLHTLRGMTLSNSTDEAAGVIDHLVDYFRYCARDEEFVTVADELQYLESYLQIQKARFGSRIKMIIHVEQQLHPCKILKLLIQPLVENAIFHGVEQKSGRGIIKVDAASKGNTVYICVLDNGRGMSRQKVAAINAALAASYDMVGLAHDKRSIGLGNINKRLKLYYGEQAGLSIKSWENAGTAIIMAIPHEKEGIGDVHRPASG